MRIGFELDIGACAFGILILQLLDTKLIALFILTFKSRKTNK